MASPTVIPPNQNQNTYQPTSGEQLLTSPPVYGGAGGGDQAAQYYAFQDFVKQFGRNPTQSELSMLAPNYMGGDPNVAALSAGKGAIASYYNSMANTPSNIANQQTQAGLQKYQAGQAGFDATTNQAFQQATGRQATADELSHFGGLLASGQIDSYGLSNLIGQTAEAQNKQTQTYQDQLSQNLQGTQGNYFKNYIEPSILSQTAAAGRDPNSSGVQNAEVQAGKQQNYDLQNYLAQFGAGQYGQSAQNQQNVYQQYLGNLYGMQNANVNQQLGQQAYMQQRNTDLANYQMQQQAYNNYLQNYGKGNSLINNIGTGLNFANAAMNLGRGGANAFGGGQGNGLGGGGGPPSFPGSSMGRGGGGGSNYSYV